MATHRSPNTTGRRSTARWRRRAGDVRICLWLVTLSFSPHAISAPPSAEYQLKAALIYKLSKFVGWPESASAGNQGAFKVCVLGDDPFGSALDALESRTNNGLPIRIHRFAQSDAIDPQCRILFISESKQPFVGEIVEKLQRLPILTIGDMSGFAREGGMMQLTRQGKRIEFTVNPRRAKQAGLEIAASLLEIAEVLKLPDQQ